MSPWLSVTQNGVYLPAAGDFNGDGTSDVLWSGTSETDPVWLFTTTRGQKTETSTSSYLPDPAGGEPSPFGGDFDGDGYGDVFWYRAN